MSRDLPPPGSDLPFLLLVAFRTLIDEAHEELARRGHPDVKPLHGFVFKAIGDGTCAADLGRTLGVSKQAAGKTIESLERLGYVERSCDPSDARSKIVRLTARGRDMRDQAVTIFAELRSQWAEQLGEERVVTLEESLRTMTSNRDVRLDIPTWFTGQ